MGPAEAPYDGGTPMDIGALVAPRVLTGRPSGGVDRKEFSVLVTPTGPA